MAAQIVARLDRCPCRRGIAPAGALIIAPQVGLMPRISLLPASRRAAASLEA